ncbi:MAG: twin-arginine translocation signal domain-containing protein [Planctomycetes bacterium]|nr:twin-arginine translocation signal domain-containing protein [Planctomycetota bacterium]
MDFLGGVGAGAGSVIGSGKTSRLINPARASNPVKATVNGFMNAAATTGIMIMNAPCQPQRKKLIATPRRP